jgi:hypothetical protein
MLSLGIPRWLDSHSACPFATIRCARSNRRSQGGCGRTILFWYDRFPGDCGRAAFGRLLHAWFILNRGIAAQLGEGLTPGEGARRASLGNIA